VTRAAGAEDFVTAVFAELDPAGWIELVICGHPPPLRLSPDGKLMPLAPAAITARLGLHPGLRLATFSTTTSRCCWPSSLSLILHSGCRARPAVRRGRGSAGSIDCGAFVLAHGYFVSAFTLVAKAEQPLLGPVVCGQILRYGRPCRRR